MKSGNNLITILGPTACGKTKLAVALADVIDGEILSADSRQVYRGMDIGTGKDLEDYTVNGRTIPYHLIDIVPAGYKYNLFEFQTDFINAYNNIVQRGKSPIMCGGTGLYLESVLKGYRMLAVPENPELRNKLENKSLSELTDILKQYKELHNTTDVDTSKRAIRAIEIEEYYKEHTVEANSFPRLNNIIVGIDIDRELRRESITKRLQQRIDNGLIEEVKKLLDSGIEAQDLIYYGLEYKYVTLYLTGQLEYKYFFQELNVAIHQFAKRQMTWFRGMEKRGLKINWINYSMSLENKLSTIQKLIENDAN
ncbi:MAG: tRNA (adenosine(37)-N6)-dimethylallyltransferase MiaA [Bacteroidaceae bacterium]|nr:tRNA (adenosine(37)-N6)-dimethylallyltransferase MiaA [Bacteroidaceae bacterium]